MRPVQKVTLSDAVMVQILDSIKSGELRAGDKLPSEKELMKEMGVSRPILREALRGLATMRVIDIRAGHGAIVTDTKSDSIIDPDLFFLSLDPGHELEQLHEFRILVEVANAGMAAERATPEDFEAIKAALDKLESAFEEGDTFPAMEFHLGIARATHNPLMLQVMKPTLTLMYKLLREREKPLFPSAREEYRIHKELYDVLLQKDSRLAKQAMLEHLQVSYNKWHNME